MSDPYGGSFVQDFVVGINDQFAPIVETESPVFEESGRIRLSGKVLDDGGSGENLEVGFLVSSEPLGDGTADVVEEVVLNLDSEGGFSGLLSTGWWLFKVPCCLWAKS